MQNAVQGSDREAVVLQTADESLRIKSHRSGRVGRSMRNHEGECSQPLRGSEGDVLARSEVTSEVTSEAPAKQ
jgi:hypothetical protein